MNDGHYKHNIIRLRQHLHHRRSRGNRLKANPAGCEAERPCGAVGKEYAWHSIGKSYT